MNKKIILGTFFAMVIAAGFVLATWEDADFNSDGSVDLIDMGIISAHFGWNNCTNATGSCSGTDMNYDGSVDITDFGIFSSYYGCYNGTNESSCYE